MRTLAEHLRSLATTEHARATLCIQWREPDGSLDWTPFKATTPLSEVLTQAADAIEALEKERDERANSQTHAEELLQTISAFLGGWTFANLDTECGEEADALDARISELFAYGWPRAQHAHSLSRPERAMSTPSERPIDFSREDFALELFIVWADRIPTRDEAENAWREMSLADQAEWMRRAGPMFEMYCIQAAAINKFEQQRDEAFNAGVEAAARVVETTVVSGPEDDDVDHDDYRDCRMAEHIRRLSRAPADGGSDAP